ncbi:hypothetical protein LJC14_07260 [Treponema sp. OttesenSCG-928-L16]|nr:hypothetical protein [Treponema sp. OttesenSCG-928-L16]
MLDKSIPHYSVIMRRPAGLAVPEAVLPEGFRFPAIRTETKRIGQK